MHQAPLRQLWKNFTYYQHQVTGVNWMLSKEIEGTSFEGAQLRGGILADDMGLGKTIEITGLICENPLPTTLLVVPVALIDQWIHVLNAAQITIWKAGKGKWLPATTAAATRPTINVFIMNYEKLYTSCFSLIRGTHFDRIILDEAHRIRSGTSAASVVLQTITSPIRWAVTGTPLVNSLKDVVSLLRFIGLKRKTSRWEDCFEQLAGNMTLRRTLSEMRGVLSDAPPEPVMHEVVLDFKTEEEAQLYRKVQTTSGTNVLEAILRMRQISVHPQISMPNGTWNLPVTKFEAIADILRSESAESASDHKYIFVCHFKREIELLREYLEHNHLLDSVFTYDGSMSSTEQATSLSAARKAQGRVALLLQIHAGGVGLNLQEFDRMIFLSAWWTSALMEQAIARTVRMGQKNVVHIYNLVLAEEMSTNIDRKILAAVNYKKQISEIYFECAASAQG
jgi:SNF2 family DNA or RNA helicase